MVALQMSNNIKAETVWENLDRGRKYRPNAVRPVHTTSVKILPYRPAYAMQKTVD